MALVKEVSREGLGKEKRAIAYIFAELVLAVLIVYQLLAVIGFKVSFFTREVRFALSADPWEYFILALSILLFIAVYFRVKHRHPRLFEAQKAAPGIIKDVAREKLQKPKADPQAAALFLIELLFVIVVVMAVYAFFDPNIELIQWSAINIEPPATTIINAIIAVIVLVLFYRVYRYTAWYRKGEGVLLSAKPAAPARAKKPKAKP